MGRLIAVDCDGPLADFTGGLCRRLTAKGFPRTTADIKHWTLSASLTPRESELQHDICCEPGFCAELEWMQGAKGLLWYLRRAGHDLVCVTSPYPSKTWIDERLTWLSPLFSRSDVMFVGGARKRHISADLLIEDHPGNTADWLDANPKGRAILVNRPWNQPTAIEYRAHPRMHRTFSAEHTMSVARELLT